MMNGENFVRLITDRDIKISVDAHSHIIWREDDEAVTEYQKYLDERPSLFQEVLRLTACAASEPIASTEQAITCVAQNIKDKPKRPENFSALSLYDYYHELENACISYKIINGHVELTGGSKKSLPRCNKLLSDNSDLETSIILREATHDKYLLKCITERASIRWCERLSDSLYSAVMCNIKPSSEHAERDEAWNIIMKERTD